MEQLVQLFGYFAILFSTSCGVAYVVATGLKKRNRLTLEQGTVLRLRCPSGIYRSMVVEETKEGFVISAPLQRDHFVAIRPGELMTVEASDKKGACLFRSRVIARRVDPHRLVIERPATLTRLERRERPRLRRAMPACLEGEEAKVVDLSEVGARVATRVKVERGERVRLDLEGRPGPVFGWVLEVVPGSLYGYDSCEARLRFEEVQQLIPT